MSLDKVPTKNRHPEPEMSTEVEGTFVDIIYETCILKSSTLLWFKIIVCKVTQAYPEAKRKHSVLHDCAFAFILAWKGN